VKSTDSLTVGRNELAVASLAYTYTRIFHLRLKILQSPLFLAALLSTSMEPSSSSASFTSLNNPTSSPDFPPLQSGYSQQYHSFPPPYFPPNIPPPPYATNQQPHYAHNFNPFGALSGYQQFRPGSSSYPYFPYQKEVWRNTSKDHLELVWPAIHHLHLDQLSSLDV